MRLEFFFSKSSWIKPTCAFRPSELLDQVPVLTIADNQDFISYSWAMRPAFFFQDLVFKGRFAPGASFFNWALASMISCGFNSTAWRPWKDTVTLRGPCPQFPGLLSPYWASASLSGQFVIEFSEEHDWIWDFLLDLLNGIQALAIF